MVDPGALVGRAGELAALVGALDGALEGRTIAVVAGEAGIGKTRLLEGLERLAGSRAMPVLWGRATNDEDVPAFWPWRQVLRAWAAGGLPGHLHGAAAALARIAPELREPGLEQGARGGPVAGQASGRGRSRPSSGPRRRCRHGGMRAGCLAGSDRGP